MEKRAIAATKKMIGAHPLSSAEGVTVKVAPARRLALGKIKSATAVKVRRAVRLTTITPATLYHTTGLDLVQIIRKGVPAASLAHIVRKMDIPKERLYASLRLPRSTVDRKIRNNDTLSAEHSERVIGLARLIGQVEVLVAQSGNPQGFDADRWVGEWLDRPLPVLGGAKPADFMDTMQGQELISQLLAQSQSGAYA